MKIYDSYLTRIKNAVGTRDQQRNLSHYESIRPDLVKAMNESVALEPKTGLETLAKLMGIQQIKKPVLGDHPDFKHLRQTGGFDYHYIVSMFIDVKGSTNFHKKYTLEQIAVIIQTIVTAATHTCALFGGHIQRLQYDGVFCYFGGKAVTKDDAVKAAMNAATFFSYFIKYELKEIFELEGIDNVYTRIGIDFGEDKDVQWVIFGTDQCTELTTNSLHTSLAPKVQSNAVANGVMIGDNVKKRLKTLEIYCDLLRDDKGNVDETNRYIYRDVDKSFYYTQWKFSWFDYLKTFSFVTTTADGKVFIDYTANTVKADAERKRLENLYEKAKTITGGGAFITPEKKITGQQTNVKLQDHNFYYDPTKDSK